MFEVPDRYTRKLEISAAFRAARLSPKADAKAYERLLKEIGVQSRMDLAILSSVLQDAIMDAVREERPTKPLETFLNWVKYEKIYH